MCYLKTSHASFFPLYIFFGNTPSDASSWEILLFNLLQKNKKTAQIKSVSMRDNIEVKFKINL